MRVALLGCAGTTLGRGTRDWNFESRYLNLRRLSVVLKVNEVVALVE